MRRFFTTREEAAKKLREWTAWGTAALLGSGVALSLSIILIPAGVALFALGVIVGIMGWAASKVIPVILPAVALRCPHCHGICHPLPAVAAFNCGYCNWPVNTREAEAVVEESPVLTPEMVGRKMLIYFTALAFIAFFVEVYLGHYARILSLRYAGIWNPSLIPVFFSPVGFLVAFITGLKTSRGTVRVFNAFMLLSILIGIAGTYFHIRPKLVDPRMLMDVVTWIGDPPALAPMSFALPGIMGLMATFRMAWPAREEAPPPEPLPRKP